MPASLTPAAAGAFQADLRGVHYHFLKDRVPDWFNQATTQRQEELASHEMQLPSWYLAAAPQARAVLCNRNVQYREALNRIEHSLGTIKEISAFAEPLLKAAIKATFQQELDVTQVYFARKYGFKSRDDLFGFFVFDQPGEAAQRYEYRGVSLLEAALANFEPDEEQSSPCSDCQLITTWSSYDGEVLPTFAAVSAQALPIAPHAFAKLCRTLDLGRLYQQHLSAIVWPEDGVERLVLERQLEEHHRQQLALSVEVGHNQAGKWGISATAYQVLQQVLANRSDVTLDGQPLTFAALKIFGCTLVGPLLIGPNRQGSDRVERVLVFIPNDPQQPLKEYASSGEFMDDLRTRLHSGSYRRFFSRFIPLRQQGGFFARFNALYKPGKGTHGGEDFPLPPKPARLELDEAPITTDLWVHLRQEQVRKIFADARAVAVPTGDEDLKARVDRLNSYVDAVTGVFNLAAFVVPGLGPIMLAVGAAQMCSEAYEGIEAYEQGDIKTMWAHFSSVALNAAFIATGAKVLPQVQLSSQVDRLKPVTLASGKPALWNPDLAPYKIPVELPADARPNEIGLYTHNGQTILPHEGDYYRVSQDAQTGHYRIQHPTRPEAYAPELETDHAGLWSHEVEEPLTWDRPTLMRRLGLTGELSAERLEQAREASGVSLDTLRQTYSEHESLPLLFGDTLERFKIHQQLSTFVEQMHSSEPAVYAKADPALQLHIMQRRGLLPETPPLRVLDHQANVLWDDPAAPALPRRVVVLSARNLARGELLKEVLYTLQGIDPALSDIPGNPEDSLEVRAGKLRQDLGQAVDIFKAGLVEERYNRSTVSRDADVQLVLDSYPRLPVAVAGRLLKDLDTAALQVFRDTGRLPENSAGLAKWCEQETRVSRAYEGLHLDSLAELDSQRLALHSLATLPGWPADSRLELRQYSAQGTLLDAIGSAQATVKKTLVLMDNGLFDAPIPRDFYGATWDALSPAEREALGLPDALALKRALQQAPLPREALRAVLLEHPVHKPAYDPTLRLLGGMKGFRERVAGLFTDPRARVRSLYPALTEAEIDRFFEVYHEDPGAQLTRLEQRYRQIDQVLKVWVHANTPDSGGTALDRIGGVAARAANEIRACWRRETGNKLSLHQLGHLELPPLEAAVGHVETLEIFNFKWSDTAPKFLSGFPNLKTLLIGPGAISEFPEVIAGLKHLKVLTLSGSNIRLNLQSAAKLGSLGNLEQLNLANNPLGMTPDFSGMPRLKRLDLNNTQLEQWPTGLRDHADLQFIDLRLNRLRAVPADFLAPSSDQLEAVTRINRVTLLKGNAFAQDAWQLFDRYWQRVSQERPDLLEGARDDAFDSGNPNVERYQRLFPAKRVHEARTFLWALGEGAQAQLSRLEQEFESLQKQLRSWAVSGGGESQRYVRVNAQPDHHIRGDDRFIASSRIWSCWRRETPQMLAYDRTPIGLELDLSGLNLPSLPDLDVDFSHVGSLKLSRMNLSASPEGFLARFRHVRWLDMSGNSLRVLPPALSEMNGLTRLDLRDSQLRLTSHTADILAGRVTLRALKLDANPLGVVPDFSQIRDLRYLGLDGAGIETWPTGLGQQPALEAVILSNNRLTTIPDAVFALTDEERAQSLRVSRVTSVHHNPLSVQTLQRVRVYGEALERAGLMSTETPNRLVSSAPMVRDNVAPVTYVQDPFRRWTQGLSADQVAARESQWAALHQQPRSTPFFDILQRLENAGTGHADLQRRVWEMVDNISERTAQSENHREELFDLAGEPGCCDRAAFSFSNLETRTMMYQARKVAGDLAQGSHLARFSRGLLRLHEVDRIAAADIARSEAIVKDPNVPLVEKRPHTERLKEEVEIRLAYRYGLKDRLQLPGQPQQVKFISMAKVSQAMLDEAYDQVIALNNTPEELQALLARDFWQDYITTKYRPQFETQRAPFHEQLTQLHECFSAQELTEGVYKKRAGDVEAQLAIKEARLIETLTRQELEAHPLDTPEEQTRR
ncbi:dermonecrotic toxin domain-containing protein [Pseudomonas sp. 32A]|uniref:dermonecrotic toxin domain-containing protein n=1 Tax=Pseudomonas sp. 32A TaxID=651185 RepID=UPI004045C1A5